MQKNLRILVAPLDWGLGHASRCIPLIAELIQQGIEPVLGGTKESLFLLSSAFPQLTCLELPAYKVRYSSGESQLPSIGLQIPRLIGVIREEHRLLGSALEKYKLDAVISDNRYGLYAKKIPSIFICHQLSLALPAHLQFLSQRLDRLHQRFIRNFNQCWIPDYKGGNNLAGKLSQQKVNMPQRYLGPLSRFNALKNQVGSFYADIPPHAPDILVVLSGPEPQRSILESKVLEQAKSLTQTFWIVQGKAGPISYLAKGNCQIISFLDSSRLSWAFARAKGIVSRSGYSSLMDYETLGINKLLLIPTPGQTEQEYLASRWAEQGRAIVQKQKHLNLEKGLGEIATLSKSESKKMKDSQVEKFSNPIRKTIAEFKKGLLETKGLSMTSPDK